MNYLLDTCVISELVKNRPCPAVVAWIESIPEDRLYLSVITLGELQKGICKLEDGARQRQLLAWLDIAVRQRFAGRILPLDEDTLMQWGSLTGTAENAGQPRPVLDSLLAATALVHHLILVTRNTADVQGTGIELLNPWPEGGR